MRPNPHPETGVPGQTRSPHPAGALNQETAMALTDPRSGQDHDSGPGSGDTPAGSSWRQAAGLTPPGLLGRIAHACHRHRWLTLAGWAAAAACLIVMWAQFGAPADNNLTSTDAGTRLINQHFPRQSGDTLTLAIRSTQPVTSPAVRDRVTSALVPFGRAPHVTAVGSPYQLPGRVSAGRHIAFATVQFDVKASKIPPARPRR